MENNVEITRRVDRPFFAQSLLIKSVLLGLVGIDAASVGRGRPKGGSMLCGTVPAPAAAIQSRSCRSPRCGTHDSPALRIHNVHGVPVRPCITNGLFAICAFDSGAAARCHRVKHLCHHPDLLQTRQLSASSLHNSCRRNQPRSSCLHLRPLPRLRSASQTLMKHPRTRRR